MKVVITSIFVHRHSSCQSPTDGIELHTLFNPLRAKFFRGIINIYLYFVSFLHIHTTQVVEIRPQIRKEPTYST